MSMTTELTNSYWEHVSGVLIARDIDDAVRRVCERSNRTAERRPREARVAERPAVRVPTLA